MTYENFKNAMESNIDRMTGDDFRGLTADQFVEYNGRFLQEMNEETAPVEMDEIPNLIFACIPMYAATK